MSLIDETARRLVQDIGTEEQRNALPDYDGDNWAVHDYRSYIMAAAFNNNITMTGKHYVSFEAYCTLTLA